MGRKKTTEEFIAEAKIKHGGKYSYEKTVYIGALQKVTVTCPTHGDFEQEACGHIKGQGCAKCRDDAKRDSFSNFIEKANVAHGYGKYDYSKTVYKNAMSDIEIICPIHGSFWQRVSNHLDGFGCKFCNGKYDLEKFILKLNNVHNGDIELCECQLINGVRNKYKFLHKKCGFEWEAQAASVLKGTGCPNCVERGFNSSKKAIFYILTINGNYSFTGFGISNNYKSRKRVHKRHLKLNSCSIQSEIFIESDGVIIQELERYIKQTLNSNNSNIDGFKTESVLISPIELKDFAVSYLDKMGYNYKLVV